MKDRNSAVIVRLLCGYCAVRVEKNFLNLPRVFYSNQYAQIHFFCTKLHFFLKKFASNMRATPSHLATQLYLRTLPWLFLSNTKNHTTPIGGRAYPVRHYPIAVRLRTRKGCAILCIALNPQSGDFSGAILGVRSVALLHLTKSLFANTSYIRRSCLPCTALPCSHTAAYPQGVRHSMYCA